MKFKKAVCALIMRGDYVLCVSRKDDPTDFGLPGGKVDDGETTLQALTREIKEETGLDVAPQRLLFKQKDGEFLVYTYHCLWSGEVKTTEKGVVKWLKWENITTNGTFKDYNLALYNKLLQTA